MRRIRRQEKQVQVARFPHGPLLLYEGRRVNAGVIEHHHGRARELPRQVVQLFHDEGGGDAIRRRGPVALVVAAKQPPAVEAKPFVGRHEHVFAGKLPAVGHVARAAHVGFVAVQKRQLAGAAEAFEFAQLIVLGRVAYGVRPAF